MKSVVTEDRYYIECACGCNNMLIFDIWEGQLSEIYLCFKHNVSLWGRIKIALLYLFKPYKFECINDSIVINEKNISEIKHFINILEIENGK